VDPDFPHAIVTSGQSEVLIIPPCEIAGPPPPCLVEFAKEIADVVGVAKIDRISAQT
jgi:hypothetical protein